MLRQLVGPVFGLFLICLLALPSRAEEITPAMRQADTRLQTRVTLRSPRILIGELLERLTKQSGVTLLADDWSTAGSDAVTVDLHDVPVADAMNALWSLFSYNHAEWDWKRRPAQASSSKFTYTLTRPDKARFLAERLQEQVQIDFEAEAQKMLDALSMTPDQLKEAAKQDFLLNSFLVDGRVGPGIRILASLPPETLQNVLHTHQGINIPVSELSPDAQKALQAAWDWEDARGVGRVLPDGKIEPMPRDSSIGISVERSSDLVAPSLYIDAGRGSGQYFGGSYLQTDWQKKMSADWMNAGDAADDPAAMRLLTDLKQANPADQSHALADYLLRFSEATRTPMIARISSLLDAGTSFNLISQVSAHLTSQKSSTKTVKGFLEGVKEDPLNLDHKWRGGVLLLTCQNWFVNESEDSRLPWAEVKRLRDAEASGEGFLALANLAQAASTLNAAQLHQLTEWFPVMSNAAQWQDLLAFFDKEQEYRPRILSAKGDDYQYPETLVNSQLGIDALRVTHPILRLQIREKQNLEFIPPTHQIMIVVLDEKGEHGLNGRGFGYPAHEYQTSLKVDEGIKADKKKSASAQP